MWNARTETGNAFGKGRQLENEKAEMQQVCNKGKPLIRRGYDNGG